MNHTRVMYKNNTNTKHILMYINPKYKMHFKLIKHTKIFISDIES